MTGHTAPIRDAKYSIDAKKIVTASEDGTARIWDAKTGMQIGQPLQHGNRVICASFDTEGRRIATGAQDGTIQLWDTATGTKIGATLRHLDAVTEVAFDSAGKYVLSASSDGTSQLWNSQTFISITSFHHSRPVCRAFYSTETTITTVSDDNTIRTWDINTSELIGVPLRSRDHGLFSVFVDQKVSRAAVESSVMNPQIWDVSKSHAIGSPLKAYSTHWFASFDRVGIQVAIAGGHAVQSFCLETGKPVSEVAWHSESVSCVSFDPTGSAIVTGSDDGIGRVWDIARIPPTNRNGRRFEKVRSCEIDLLGRYAVTSQDDGVAVVWDGLNGSQLGTLSENFEDGILHARLNPAGSLILTTGFSRVFQLWDLATLSKSGERHPYDGDGTSPFFDPSGRFVGARSKSGIIRYWEIAKREWVEPDFEVKVPHIAPSFDHQGVRGVLSSDKRTLQLWDCATISPRGRPLNHDCAVRRFAIDPRGVSVFTLTEDNSKQFWNAETGTIIGEPDQSDTHIRSAKFDHGGRRMLIVGSDSTVWIYDAASGLLTGKLLHHDARVVYADTDSGGIYIFTGCADSTVHIWDAETLDLLSSLHFDCSIVDGAFFSDRMVVALSDGAFCVFSL